MATYRAFDKVAERQEVFAMSGFLVFVAGRLAALLENSVVEWIVEDAVRGAFADAVASDVLASAR